MMQPDFAQNPDELFDIVNEDGSPTGRVKRRADVHRDGDWHRAVHVWIYGDDGEGPFILFNWRSPNKDTMPGRLDVTVGGHLGAGESSTDAFREIEEEIGAPLDQATFRFLFVRRAEGETERELQDVFLVRDDRELSAYRPNPAELAGLVRMPLDSALEIFGGGARVGMGVVLDAETGAVSEFEINDDNLMPQRTFPYFLDIARAVANQLAMETTPRV